MKEFLLFPAVGAIIGYLTNDIAIRMLFRPYEEKRFMGKRVPFTPGLIPSQRQTIAANIAEVFEKHLLSNDEIHSMFTSESLKAGLEKQIKTQINTLCGPSGELTKEENLDKLASEIQSMLGQFAPEWLNKLIDEKAAPMADQMIDEAFKSLGPLAAFAGGFKGKISERIIDGVGKFAQEAGSSLQSDETRSQIKKLLKEQIDEGQLSKKLQPLAPRLSEAIADAIEKSLLKAVEDGSLDIRRKLEDKINSLPVSKLEEIILGFSRQQFRYISLFGGLLGALIGLAQACLAQL